MGANILVVDDDRGVQELLLNFLQKKEYCVELASNGEEALEKIKEKSFAAIITDLKMPGISGLELLKKIKEMGIDSPVIIITGYGTIDSAIEGIKEGAFDFIEKPLELNELENLVTQVLQRPSEPDELLIRILKDAEFNFTE